MREDGTLVGERRESVGKCIMVPAASQSSISSIGFQVSGFLPQSWIHLNSTHTIEKLLVAY